MNFLSLIPLRFWLWLFLAITVAAGLFALERSIEERGEARIQAKWDADKVRMAAALEKEKSRQAKVVEKVVVEYRDRVKVVKEKGDEIVKAVPVYIHGSCELDGGFRVLHDAATDGSFPADPERAIAAAPGVDEITVAQTVAANYATCRETAERLTALQQLVKGIAP